MGSACEIRKGSGSDRDVHRRSKPDFTKTKKGKQLCFSISIVEILIHVFGKQTIKFHVLLIDLGCRTLHDPALGCLSLKAVTVVNPKWDEFCRKIEATTVISTEWGDS